MASSLKSFQIIDPETAVFLLGLPRQLLFEKVVLGEKIPDRGSQDKRADE
jgi:hypothetical protein